MELFYFKSYNSLFVWTFRAFCWSVCNHGMLCRARSSALRRYWLSFYLSPLLQPSVSDLKWPTVLPKYIFHSYPRAFDSQAVVLLERLCQLPILLTLHIVLLTTANWARIFCLSYKINSFPITLYTVVRKLGVIVWIVRSLVQVSHYHSWRNQEKPTITSATAV